MNHEHSQNDKTMRLKWLGGNSKVLAGFCINIGKLEGRRNFSQLDLWEHIVRGTISFCNNIITILPVGESFGGMFKCCAMDVVEGELFRF